MIQCFTYQRIRRSFSTNYRGKSFQRFNLIDELVRQELTMEINFSLLVSWGIRVLEQLEEIHELPDAIRLNKGPEPLAAVFTKWCETRGIELKYIQPSKPQHNAYIERHNRTYRNEPLNAYLFDDLDQAPEITKARNQFYKDERTHGALGKPPFKFLQTANRKNSFPSVSN